MQLLPPSVPLVPLYRYAGSPGVTGGLYRFLDGSAVSGFAKNAMTWATQKGIINGVGGNYLLWAGFLFLLIVNERLWFGKLMKRSVVFCHIYVVVTILLSWVPFAVGDWGQMVEFLGRLFGVTGMAVNSRDFIYVGSEYVPMLLGGLVFATPWPRKLWEKLRHTFVADILMLGLFWVVVYFISTAAQDPFMYFQY